jgi:hypothetical protein
MIHFFLSVKSRSTSRQFALSVTRDVGSYCCDESLLQPADSARHQVPGSTPCRPSEPPIKKRTTSTLAGSPLPRRRTFTSAERSPAGDSWNRQTRVWDVLGEWGPGAGRELCAQLAFSQNEVGTITIAERSRANRFGFRVLLHHSPHVVLPGGHISRQKVVLAIWPWQTVP